jgi:hypothetical protein
MTYACPSWESAADNHLLKLQRLQNKVLRTIGNFPRHTPDRDLHKVLKLPHLYDYITKLCRQQAEVIQNHDNKKFATLDKARPETGNMRGINLAAVNYTTVQVTRLSL